MGLTTYLSVSHTTLWGTPKLLFIYQEIKFFIKEAEVLAVPREALRRASLLFFHEDVLFVLPFLMR